MGSLYQNPQEIYCSRSLLQYRPLEKSIHQTYAKNVVNGTSASQYTPRMLALPYFLIKPKATHGRVLVNTSTLWSPVRVRASIQS